MDEEARLQDSVFHRGEGRRARRRSEHGERWNRRENLVSHFDVKMGINIESAKTIVAEDDIAGYVIGGHRDLVAARALGRQDGPIGATQ